MSPLYLKRVDIRQSDDPSTNSITLRYVGRQLKFHDRLFGYPDGVFFVVSLGEVPLPEPLTSLARRVGVDLEAQRMTKELRRAVAEVLLAEAILTAPMHLAECATPMAFWYDEDRRTLEHKLSAAESRVRDITKMMESNLRRREPMCPPTTELVVPAPPVTRSTTMVPPPPVELETDDPEVDDSGLEASETVGKKILTAVKRAREAELPQRLPAGARKALDRLPHGIYLVVGSTLTYKRDICVAMVDGAEGGRKGSESVIIDWDGEWPVVARRYGSHGRIVYRVEEALRRAGVTMGEAA